MILHRYLRYTPVLAVIILFSMSFTKYLGRGPFFDPPGEECVKNWWSSLIHVSVYTNPTAIVTINKALHAEFWKIDKEIYF